MMTIKMKPGFIIERAGCPVHPSAHFRSNLGTQHATEKSLEEAQRKVKDGSGTQDTVSCSVAVST